MDEAESCSESVSSGEIVPASTHKPIMRSLKYIGNPENTPGFDIIMPIYKSMVHLLLQSWGKKKAGKCDKIL